MKIKFRTIIFCLLGLCFTSCEDYLDKSPDMSMTDSVIYKDYESMRGFLDQIFNSNDYLIYMYESEQYANGSSCIGDVSDEYVNVRKDGPCLNVRSGNWLSNADEDFEIGSQGKTPIARAYKGIRVVNRVINNIDKVNNLTEEERKNLLGQAHFLRAYFYFELIKRYGGMPKFDMVFEASDNFDLPRMTYQESNNWLQSDLDLAIEYLPIKWPDEEHGRPDRCSALALKTMTELYAASPLMQNGLDAIEYKEYDRTKAAEAARTAVKTLQAIDESGYYALTEDYSKYKDIFTVPNPDTSFGHPEYLWYTRYHPGNWQAFKNVYWLTDPYVAGTGPQQAPYHAPSQNMVDLFERKGTDGKFYPITDQRSGYDAVKNNDPYSNRDPRLKEFILVPGEAWGINNDNKQLYITTYKGGYSENFILTQTTITRGALQSGYMCKKFIWESMNQYSGLAGYKERKIFSVYIRVSQVYLDLAEAMFEATGDPDKTLEGCGDWTARKALNKIRNRAGIGDLPDVDFREAYRRERAIELMFEGHRWYDIRRWMIADKLFAADYPIFGVEATPKNTSYSAADLIKPEAVTYKIDEFTYQYIPITTEIRVFDMRNYWYPFPMDEVAALDNLKQNPGW